MPIAKLQDNSCSVARSLSILGQRWTLLILRVALEGETRFEAFREALGMAPDVLKVVVGGLQQWGDAHLPRPEGPTVLRRARKTARPERAAFVDDRGREVPLDQVERLPTAAYPTKACTD